MAESSRLPGVPLQWSDFMWSLERLRSKPYGKKMRERDWFRINPLEMVLLGCQSLSSNAPAKRDHGTMILVMEPIRDQMRMKPRYWKRLYSVLFQVLQGDTPMLILQRCCSAVLGIWNTLKEIPEFQSSFCAWCITDLKVAERLKHLVETKRISASLELKQMLAEIDNLCSSAESSLNAVKQKGLHWKPALTEVFLPLLEEFLAVPTIGILLHILLSEAKDCDSNILSCESLQKLLTAIKECSSDTTESVFYMLSIVQLVMVRSRDLAESNLLTDEGEGEQKVKSDADGLVGDLILALAAALMKWKEMTSSQMQDVNSDIPAKLLSIAEVILAAKPLREALREAIEFFQWPIAVLMSYSTEGYLSDSPHEFFVKLLEFVTTGVEQGEPPMTVLQSSLPNLFGPAFGIKNHAVSCKLLEYGYLAVCSQHRKSLLTEGLKFLMNVFHLFPPIDEVRTKAKAKALHLEAMHVSQLIVKELLNSLQLQEEVGSRERDDVSPEEVVPELPKLEGDGHDSFGSEDLFRPLSDMERDLDKTSRLQVLLRLLQLACAMIQNGDNISFVYASILPKLFQESPLDVPVRFNREKLSKFFGEDPPPPPSSIPWKVDKKKLALQLLDLSILSVESDVATPFQLCGIVVPKLVKNLEGRHLPEEEKMALTIDILKITQETLEAGHSIDELISHGIDLLSNLLPVTSSGDELKQFIIQMARQLATANYSSLLFLVKSSCQFMKASFPEEVEDIQGFFRALIFRGKRDEIRCVFHICKEQLKEERYAPLRQFIYGYSNGSLSHRQLLALCELLISAMDVEKPQRSVREFWSNVDVEDEEMLQQKREQEVAVITKLTAPCLHDLQVALHEERMELQNDDETKFKRDVWESISSQLSQIALFRTLFQSELATFGEFSKDKLLDTFKSKFPQEVLCNENMMHLLALCATRIEHVQTPRFNSLKATLSGLLRHFLTLEIPPQRIIKPGHSCENASESEVMDTLEARVKELDCFLDVIPRNSDDKCKLIECGYSSSLWEEKLSLTVNTDGSRSLDENMRHALLACYTEFADILKQLAITHLSVDGEMVKSTDLFSDELSLAEMKGRRAIAVRAIDQRLGRTGEGHFYERKVALLAKEDEIEADFEKQAKIPVKPKTFTATVNTRFFDCAKCCGSQIIGCYAPTGEHCEKPLEIGMRCDSAIASLCDESGLEIENLEILFTEEGAYIFKAYSNGHPYDTSQVWVSLFTAMLKEPSLVPAIIIPKSYPNQRTWESLRRCVSTEMTGSILTCRPDFSPEWRTYYDHRPEKVRLDMDMILHQGFILTTDQSQSRPPFQRQRSKLAKDLAGLIFEVVMQDLLEDEWLKQFRFLGKMISQYISECVQGGERRPNILLNGFDYDRWKKMFTKLKNPPDVPLVLTDELSLPPTKEKIVSYLLEFVDQGIISWCMNADLARLCVNNHRQLLELKGFLERTRYFVDGTELRKCLTAVHKLLGQCTFVVPLLSLPDSLQDEIIHWVFRNEDRVWRYRGGRDGHETLQQFMNFLGRGQKLQLESGTSQGQNHGTTAAPKQQKPYAGVVVFCVPNVLESGKNTGSVDANGFQVEQMIAYALGEMAKPTREGEEVEEELLVRWYPASVNCYEVVTAWVHPRYRSLNLSVQMYLEIMKHAPARLVMCDMLQGSVERIISSNWLLQLLDKLRISRLVLQKRQQSYLVTTQTGRTEQFEQVIFNVHPLRIALWVHRSARWIKLNSKVFSMVALTTATVAVALYYLPNLLSKI